MRRGSVSSWEPWARRNSANMAQISGSRSEFMTSDLGLSDIEYKRKGGCFLSYKKAAVIIVMFIIGVIAAGLIGAYTNPLGKTRSSNAFPLAEDDEIDGLRTPAKFISSPLILPTLYTIELTPVLEGSIVKKFSGRVIISFNYNGTQPLSQLVLNAKGMNVTKSKLLSLDDNSPRNIHSRKRRADDIVQESLNSDDNNSTNTMNTTITDNPVTDLPDVTVNDVGSAFLANSSSTDDVLNVTASTDIGNESVALNNSSSNENMTTDDTSISTSTPAGINIMENETYPEKKNDSSLAASSDQPVPVVIQKIAPSVNKSRPMIPETSIPNKSTEIHIAIDEMDRENGFYVIHPDFPIKGGNYSVEITYETNVDGQNTFANVYELGGQRKWLLATKLKPLGPRTLFPSFNQPYSKPRFSLSIARPKTLITLANMPLQSSDSVSDDWVMDHFEKSPPLSSTNLAFLVGDVQPIREITIAGDTKIPLTLWAKSNKIEETHFIVNKMEAVARILNQFFSTPYTMPKLDVVAMPDLVVDGMGSTGLISIRESLCYTTEESSAISKELAIKNLVKLIGEQWLGGLVSTKSWSDAWILEGTLIYLENLLTEKIDQTLDSFPSMGIVQHEAFEADAYGVPKTLDSKFTLASLETDYPRNAYRRGACLIRMLHNVMSDSGFRNGYKKFLSGWLNVSASVSDFWDSMSDEAHWLPDGVSLSEVMTSWVSQGGFPVLTITRNYETRSALVRQEQFALDNSTITKRQFWYIPLTYITDGDDWSLPRKSWFKQEEEITIKEVGNGGEKNKWLLFNVNQTGYYRVNYDLDNWNLLSSGLNSTFEKFPVTTRTSLVDDALSLAWGKRLGYPTALNLIRYLEEKETHHSPWTVALQNMIKLNNLLENTPAYSKFQEFMIKFISPLFKKVTSTSAAGDTQLKLMAIKWACLIDNPECRSYLRSLSSVPSYLEETFECTLAKFGGKSEWDSLLSKTLKAKNRETRFKLLSAFPCFQIDWILQSILNDILNGEKFDVQETIILLQSFSKNPTAARSAFKFLRSNSNEIFQRFSTSYPISRAFFIASMNGIIDDQDLKDFQIFKEENHDKLKYMGYTIAVSEAEARSRISWLKTNLIPFQSWLEDYIRPIS